MKKLLIIVLLLLTTTLLFAEEDPGRVALIVGNSTYEASPLTNPENDAKAMAKVLKSAGFKVILSTNRSLREMENDLSSFRKSISKGDVALFFYAGHGVQVDGANYLLPINDKGIGSSYDLKRRAMDAQDYVNAMADSGAALNIIMLDACRDNPLPSASRSGTRGLAVMSAPRDSETVIVYATKAGDVALDGRGSNSTFTTAFLDVVKTPDLDLLSMFNEVGSKVKEETSGKQIPTIYTEPLSRTFTFFSSRKQAEEARQASNVAMAEVESMEAKIALLKAQFEKSQNDKEKENIELEQKRQEALLAAQKLQADNLAAEADRRAANVARAEADAKQRAIDAANANARQNKLAKLAEERRTELAKLSRDVQSEDPDVLIATIERLESVIKEVETEYDNAWRTSELEIRGTFSSRYTDLGNEKPEIWETDEEFNKRIKTERTKINSERDVLLAHRKRDGEAEKAKQTESIRSQLKDAVNKLKYQSWTLKGSDVELIVGEYNRNAKIWPFTVVSKNPSVPVPSWYITADFSGRANFRDKLVALDGAVKADALTAEIVWKIEREEESSKLIKYYVVLSQVLVRNIVDNSTVVKDNVNKQIATFVPGRRNAAKSLFGTVSISPRDKDAEIYIVNKWMGTAPLTLTLLEGDYKIEGRWADGDIGATSVILKAGTRKTVSIIKPPEGFLYVEGGTFQMGSFSGNSDEAPVHKVTLNSFIISKYEVTQGEYKAVMGSNPSSTGSGIGDNYPVNKVSWLDAVEYCNSLSRKEGLTPVYTISGRNVSWDKDADGYRLPTEAEWEFAARGGNLSKGYTYSGSNNLDSVAWYLSNSNKKIHFVGTKQPNELGLYDMSGNVWEWCWDFYGEYSRRSQTDPVGATSGNEHVRRGGGWYWPSNNASNSRSTNRYFPYSTFGSGYDSESRYSRLGFRVVRHP